MKVKLEYQMLYDICSHISEKISNQNIDEIIAISRGGITAAHIVSKQLRLPVGYFIPKNNKLILNNENSTNIVFIEDLIAKGRTYNLVDNFMKINYPQILYQFIPIVVDVNSPITPNIYGIKTDSWIVFPYEDYNKTKEKDWGLFRNNTDKYSK